MHILSEREEEDGSGVRSRREKIVCLLFVLCGIMLFARVFFLNYGEKNARWMEMVSIRQQIPLLNFLEEEQPHNVVQTVHFALSYAVPWYSYERLYLMEPENSNEEADVENRNDEADCEVTQPESISLPKQEKMIHNKIEETEETERTEEREEREEEPWSEEEEEKKQLQENFASWSKKQMEKEIDQEEVVARIKELDENELLASYFTVDAMTDAESLALQTEDFLLPAVKKKSKEDIGILIYHTHGSETYRATQEDEIQGVMQAGELLGKLLEEEYGYHVIHLTDYFDQPSRDEAYSNALPVLEQTLLEHPEIDVMIDLHRDEVKEDHNLGVEVDGLQATQFMFFHGLSYTKEQGQLTGLPNTNLKANMAFALRMKLAAEQLCPGITRKTYLKGYRYNLHLRAASILVELGAQNTTGEQAKASVVMLAKVLDTVLCYEISR